MKPPIPLELIDRSRCSVYDLIDSTDRQSMIVKLLGRLPEREKEVVYLYFFEGLTLTDISKEIGKCPRTVANTRNKGLRMLRHPTRVRQIMEIFTPTVGSTLV